MLVQFSSRVMTARNYKFTIISANGCIIESPMRDCIGQCYPTLCSRLFLTSVSGDFQSSTTSGRPNLGTVRFGDLFRTGLLN
jgi:hypothetical protein